MSDRTFDLLRRIDARAAAPVAQGLGPAVAFEETGTAPRSITFPELARHVAEVRAFVRASLIAREGERPTVMLCCPNRIEFPVWFLGLISAGCDVFPVSTELTSYELRVLAGHAGVAALVADAPTCAALSTDVCVRWGVEHALVLRDRTGCPSPVHTASDAKPGALLLASSGSTGAAKVVRRTARSLDAVAGNMVEAIGLQSRDTVVAAVPLSHSYGLEHGLLAPLWAGSTVTLIDGFDLGVLTAVLAADRTMVFPAVPSMLEMLASSSDASLSMEDVRLVYTAGGPLPPQVYEQCRERFGVCVGQLYGMTEIGSVTFSRPGSDAFDPRSVGRAMRDVSLRVVDLADPSRGVAPGDEGEILVKAPSMCESYVGEADGGGSSAGLVDGHFRTGDVGRLDDHGNLTITGRVRLLIDTGGLKVNPFEVEGVIGAHPGVLECVVVPVRQSETIQRLRAIVVPQRGTGVTVSPEAIRSFVRQRLAGYKVPRVVELRSSLPRTATGKLQRHLLTMETSDS